VTCGHARTGRTPVGDVGWSDGVLEVGFGDPAVAALVGWPTRVERMVEVEAALGRALARAGVIPAEAGAAVARACSAASVDLDALAVATAAAPTPVIPLVQQLRAGADPLAAAWLHHGATSQDIIDTAVALQLREALDAMERRLLAVADRCASLADAYRGTVMAGRTLGQQAVPITFGLKAARWLGAIDRRIEQLRYVAPRVLTVQLGGAAGTSAVYGAAGVAVAEALAAELGLSVPDLPWHAERDRIAELAGALSSVAVTVEHVATDLVLLAQTEVGEVREAAGDAPSSSAMPHKRNPAHATAARAASRLALGDLGVLSAAAGGHEHERSAGAWQAEWVALPSALVRTGGALLRLHRALEGIEVDAARARTNLEVQFGLTASEALAAALTPALGRPGAQEVVSQVAAVAARQRRAFRDVAGDDPAVTEVLDDRALDVALDPTAAVPAAAPLIDRALETHDRLRNSGRP
jgi:3-carboxy-cis,cis-muconate cycloisomerase